MNIFCKDCIFLSQPCTERGSSYLCLKRDDYWYAPVGPMYEQYVDPAVRNSNNDCKWFDRGVELNDT